MLLTDGAQGGLAIDVGGGRQSRASPPVAAVPAERFVDPVGAGDTFLAGVFAARIDPTLLAAGRGPRRRPARGRRGRLAHPRGAGHGRRPDARGRAARASGPSTSAPLGRQLAAVAAQRAPSAARRAEGGPPRAAGAAVPSCAAVPAVATPPGSPRGRPPDPRAGARAASRPRSRRSPRGRRPRPRRSARPRPRRTTARAAGAPAPDRRRGARRSSGRRRPMPRCRPSPTRRVRARAARRGRSRARPASPSAAPARRTSVARVGVHHASRSSSTRSRAIAGATGVRPNGSRTGGADAEGVVEAGERVLVALLPAVGAGEAGEVAARRRRGGPPGPRSACSTWASSSPRLRTSFSLWMTTPARASTGPPRRTSR